MSAPPISGDGTDGNPYQIVTLENLYWIAEDSSRFGYHYAQTADINAAETAVWFDGNGFLPIGNKDNPFTGSYDGQGHTIDSLSIDRFNIHIGLFGVTVGALIQNLGLTNVDIQGASQVGGLVGTTADYSTINNCYVTGSVGGFNSVGGLVSLNENSTITKSFATVSVTGVNSIGGLVGMNSYSSTIDNSYSTGSVSGGSYVGGLIGFNYSVDPMTMIKNSYAAALVSGNVSVGGLVGARSSDNPRVIRNSFWDVEASGQNSSGGGAGKSTEEMKSMATFTNLASGGLSSPWDFVGNPYDDRANEDVWDMDSTWVINQGYPYHHWQSLRMPGR